jgi:UDP-glucuronate 4-epimerase
MELKSNIKVKILVTGCAGFIGSHVCEKLMKDKENIVIGIDNINDYYDVKQKFKNLEILKNISENNYKNFTFIKEDIVETNLIEELKPDKVCHLAAMAGVRYSIENPKIYARVNIEGFINLLNQSVKVNVKNFVYASSSSVYGLNEKVPFSEDDDIVSCNSPYAASKRAKEVFAKTYNQLYGMPLIGLRFFTVYGPRGRPDMAPYKFLKAIMDGTEFKKYGDGSSMRDYTYIDDIVSGIISALENKNNLSCEIFNLGNSDPVSLNTFINTCEKVSNKKALYKTIENQLGDVPKTYADIKKAKKLLDYDPKTNLEDGLRKTYEWLKQYNNIHKKGEIESII